MTLAFTAQGIPFKADLLVTNFVDELMLGFDWLRTNRCQWLLDQSVLVVGCRRIPLRSRPSHASIRRVYVHEDTLVPSGVKANIPVDVTWSSLCAPKADWMVETKRLCPSVYVARTLLSGKDSSAAVRLVNASNYACKVKAGDLLGNAALLRPRH